MDIASRLRMFMAEKGIASSQFADNADIPRPTLSQLLNGRNKKISNELIGKIHEAYPSLSVLWLMFGEGDMETGVNMQTSAPQSRPENEYNSAQEPRYEAVFVAQAPDYTNVQRREIRSENYSVQHNMQPTLEKPIPKEAMQALSNAGARAGEAARVQQIMVLYTDGRFETFKPTEQ